MVATNSLKKYLKEIKKKLSPHPTRGHYDNFVYLKELYETNIAMLSEAKSMGVRDVRARKIIADIGEKTLRLYDMLVTMGGLTKKQRDFLEENKDGVLRLQETLDFIASTPEGYWSNDANWPGDWGRERSDNRRGEE